MSELDLKLISEAEQIRTSPEYINTWLLPHAQSDECRKRLKEEYDRAWITAERTAFDRDYDCYERDYDDYCD